MKSLHALALSIALLVALWVYLSIGIPSLHFSPWIGFVAWAVFFAAGGGTAALAKALPAGIAGAVLTALTMIAVGRFGGGLSALLILVPILAFVLVAMADQRWLSYTPAAFLGAAAFFGTGGDPAPGLAVVCSSWVAGLALGFASEWLGKKLARAEPPARPAVVK
jgi:hypothetical protein